MTASKSNRITSKHFLLTVVPNEDKKKNKCRKSWICLSVVQPALLPIPCVCARQSYDTVTKIVAKKIVLKIKAQRENIEEFPSLKNLRRN